MNVQVRQGFWQEACAIRGSVTLHALPYILSFGLIATGICVLAWLAEKHFQVRIGLEVAPFEMIGVALGLLLVLRTNSGYDRWWEARKLWGGIVNQSRNLAIDALAYGPVDREWREQMIQWTAVFPYAAKCTLRGEPPAPEVADLIGVERANQVGRADHAPTFVAMKLADLLREACDRFDMDRFAFLQLDRERAELIDHIGACERILKTPLPLVYAIKIRRFIALFLLTIPFALLHQIDTDWLVPFITMLVAYPLISLDQIGIELQNPFALTNLSHLPLNEISATIERNVTHLWKTRQEPAFKRQSQGVGAA